MSDPPLSTLVRGYPPVLGAMLLVDGVLTVILGGDATVSLGEVVAYLLLPPLAMFLLTRLTGGRPLSPVTIGAGAAGAAVIFASLFLGGGVHLLTLPGWVLAVVGLVLLAVAVVLMRRSAPGPAVAPLLSEAERDGFSERDDREESGRGGYGDFGASRDEFGAAPREDVAHDDFGAARREEYGTRSRDEYNAQPGDGYAAQPGDHYGSGPSDYGRSAEPDWPPARRDGAFRDSAFSASADDPVAGLPHVPPTHAAGPPEPEWPPHREPLAAGPAWSDHDDARPDGSANRQWPPSAASQDWPPAATSQVRPAASQDWPSAASQDWPPHRDPEPAPDAQRSWFDSDEPAEPSDSSDSSEREWPPSGGRRSRRQDQ